MQLPFHWANLEAIRKALTAGGSEQVETIELAGLNHLFQHAETGAMDEYSKIEETFAIGALQLISDWIPRQTAPGTAEQALPNRCHPIGRDW